MKTVVIDAGHGGTDPGAIGGGMLEKDLTLAITKHIESELDKFKVNIILTRTDDKTVLLADRIKKANEAKANLFLSIHVNSASGTNGTGYEDFIHDKHSDSSQTGRIRSIIHAEIAKMLQSKTIANRGMKKADFRVLREPKMPSILTENLFINNPNDQKFLRDDAFLKEIAAAHVKGIVIALDLEVKEVMHKVEQPKVIINNNKPDDWAGDSWRWGMKVGLCDGTRPKENITRQEVVAMFERFANGKLKQD